MKTLTIIVGGIMGLSGWTLLVMALTGNIGFFEAAGYYLAIVFILMAIQAPFIVISVYRDERARKLRLRALS